MLVNSVLKAYQNERLGAGYSPETIDRVVGNIKMYCRETRVRSIEKMTTDNVIRWGTTKLLNGKKQSTISAYYNSIRSLICYLDDIGVPHALDKTRIHCKPVYERMVCLRPNDVKRIACRADEETSLLIRLMYSTGMRISEATSLTPFHITGTEIYIRGKGGKVRTVFTTASIADELKTREAGESPFFDLDRSTAYYRIKKAMVTAGYPTAYPHSLRHTFTTTMLRQGADISHVQRLLGHSNISTTARYTHLVTDDIKKAHAKFLIEV